MKAYPKKTRFLIWGYGVTGRALVENLHSRGYPVQVIDDLSTGRIANIAHLKEDSRFSYVLDTVMNQQLMLELVDEAAHPESEGGEEYGEADSGGRKLSQRRAHEDDPTQHDVDAQHRAAQRQHDRP